MNKELFGFIKSSPTAFHATASAKKMLLDAGAAELLENQTWEIENGKIYFVTRNMSSLIAFRVPENHEGGFMITASHSDSPCFRIKENAEMADDKYIRLSTEKYGGMLCSSWLDRPLSVAGRIVLKTTDGIETKLVDFCEPCAVIPNVAIHMNRNANDGMTYNAAVDMLPLYSGENIRKKAASLNGANEDDVLSTELYVYNPQEPVGWGKYISSPRLDDLQCAFGSLYAFCQARLSKSVQVFCMFDNEEVGSGTKQGAASTFLEDVLRRIAGDDRKYMKMLSDSFLVSCDNAHAVHPNHPEYKDTNHSVYMNGGVVIKYNANQKYTSDAVSSALFKLICSECDVPFQLYANRADMAGGSTLGNIANTHVSVNSVDIGLAQLAMHSAYETAGADDTEYLVRVLTAFYEKSLKMHANGKYTLE